MHAYIQQPTSLMGFVVSVWQLIWLRSSGTHGKWIFGFTLVDSGGCWGGWMRKGPRIHSPQQTILER
jgi:hypothetical protein